MHPALFEIPQRLGVAWELPLVEHHGLLQHLGRIGGRGAQQGIFLPKSRTPPAARPRELKLRDCEYGSFASPPLESGAGHWARSSAGCDAFFLRERLSRV